MRRSEILLLALLVGRFARGGGIAVAAPGIEQDGPWGDVSCGLEGTPDSTSVQLLTPITRPPVAPLKVPARLRPVMGQPTEIGRLRETWHYQRARVREGRLELAAPTAHGEGVVRVDGGPRVPIRWQDGVCEVLPAPPLVPVHLRVASLAPGVPAKVRGCQEDVMSDPAGVAVLMELVDVPCEVRAISMEPAFVLPSRPVVVRPAADGSTVVHVELSRVPFGWLGVTVDDVDGRRVVVEVLERPDGGAVPLQEGDEVLRIDGRSARRMDLLAIAWSEFGPAHVPVRFVVRRAGRLLHVVVERTRMPIPPMEPFVYVLESDEPEG